MAGKLGALVTRKWPIKLAAVFLSVMLYVGVAGQQPATQLFSLTLALDAPRGRTVRSELPTVAVHIRGRGLELLKLRSVAPVLRFAVPDTLTGAEWVLHIQPGDVRLPQGADVRVDDIVPRDIRVQLDPVSSKDVRIVPLVTVIPDSGHFLEGGIALTPSVVRLVGSEQALAAVESVTTAPVRITGVTGFFTRMVPIDTLPLGMVRVSPKQVEISADVRAVAARVFSGVPVETGAGALRTFEFTPARVTVSVEGPADAVEALSRDSIRVVAHLSGPATAGAVARLTVIAPRGVSARATPDSVAVRRRGRS
ncbi:MAG: CdaR family protein [Gemmatimonadales bacterium]